VCIRIGRASLARSDDADVQELFQFIHRYSPIDIELDTHYMPFIPEYIPAIGDIDAFIKVPRPDGIDGKLGLEIVDEPATEQSIPSVLELQLRAISKVAGNVPTTLHSIKDSRGLKKNPKELNAWIKSLQDLHQAKPQQNVKYSRRMPDVEELMQAWPPEIEQAFKRVSAFYHLFIILNSQGNPA
jgi:intraflagellar transport protein 46